MVRHHARLGVPLVRLCAETLPGPWNGENDAALIPNLRMKRLLRPIVECLSTERTGLLFSSQARYRHLSMPTRVRSSMPFSTFSSDDFALRHEGRFGRSDRESGGEQGSSWLAFSFRARLPDEIGDVEVVHRRHG